MKMRPLLSEQEHLSLNFLTHEIKAACLLLKVNLERLLARMVSILNF